MIVTSLAFFLAAPGQVVDLEPASVGQLLDSGVLVLRDNLDGQSEEVLYLLRTDCGPYGEDAPELVASRWADRWKTVDWFEVAGPREVLAHAEDDGGQWYRTCAVTEVLSCYVSHGDEWVGAAAYDGGLDPDGDWDAAVASVVAWARGGPYPCTRARIARRGKAGPWSVQTR